MEEDSKRQKEGSPTKELRTQKNNKRMNIVGFLSASCFRMSTREARKTKTSIGEEPKNPKKSLFFIQERDNLAKQKTFR